MKLLRALLALGLALGVQAALVQIWPSANRYVDVLLVPVVWYGIVRSQRSSMLMGCAAGLFQDAWFQVGVFGLNGFKKTLIGWALGGLGTRFDLNSTPGRLAAGTLCSVADSILDVALRSLLDLNSSMPDAGQVAIRAITAGLLVAWTFGIIERGRQSRMLARWV